MKKRMICIGVAMLCLMICLMQMGPIKANAATSGQCGGSTKWNFDTSTGTLTISGSGEMKDYQEKSAPWQDHKAAIQKIVIQQGVRKIGTYAFYGCSVQTVEIPTGIASIGDRAFADCTQLTEVYFKGYAPSMHLFAFSKVTATVYYPAADPTWTASQKLDYDGKLTWCADDSNNDVPSGIHGDVKWELKGNTLYIAPVGDKAGVMDSYPVWVGYKNFIEKVVMTGQMESIAIGAFDGCAKLTEVQWPDGLKMIGSYAFRKCKALTTLTIPDTVTEINDSAFQGCSGLKTIQLPQNLTFIATGVFVDCYGLQSITIPACVNRLKIFAFKGCSSLKTIYFEGYLPILDEEQWKFNGTFSQIGRAVTIYYPENELTWTAEKVQSLQAYYAGENVTFTAYQPEPAAPETTPSQPVVTPTESVPTQNGAEDTTSTTGEMTTEPTGIPNDTDKSQNTLLIVVIGVVVLVLAISGCILAKIKITRNKQA